MVSPTGSVVVDVLAPGVLLCSPEDSTLTSSETTARSPTLRAANLTGKLWPPVTRAVTAMTAATGHQDTPVTAPRQDLATGHPHGQPLWPATGRLATMATTTPRVNRATDRSAAQTGHPSTGRAPSVSLVPCTASFGAGGSSRSNPRTPVRLDELHGVSGTTPWFQRHSTTHQSPHSTTHNTHHSKP